jgi:sigma-E factor negative regulatory protein RseA
MHNPDMHNSESFAAVSHAERLSALVDDATTPFETRRLLDDVLQSSADRQIWARYHLMGDCIRGGMVQIAPADFLSRIRPHTATWPPLEATDPSPATAASAASTVNPPLPAVAQCSPNARLDWRLPVVGIGIAASVALASVLALQLVQGLLLPQDPAVPATALAGETDLRGTTPLPLTLAGSKHFDLDVPPASEPAASGVADLDPRFARYLENHAELLTPGSSAFARVRNSVDGQ